MKGDALIIGPGQIRLFGTIVPDAWIWSDDEGLFSSIMVADALSQMTGDVELFVNCDGGNPFEGEAIRAALEAYPHNITVKVQGAAHSAASLMIMAANSIELSAGSMMLIHDPSNGVFGNAAEQRASADKLDVIANTYAAVYATHTGMTVEEVRAIMIAETLYSPEAAVEAGFADVVTAAANSGAQMSAPDMNIVMQRVEAAFGISRQAEMKFKTGESQTPGSDGATTLQGSPMPKELKNGAEITTTPPAVAPATPEIAPVAAPVPTAPVMTAGDVENAVTAERSRATAIRTAAAPFMAHMSVAQVDELINKGTSVADANVAIMSYAAAGNVTTPPAATIQRDEVEAKVNGIIGALMHRSDPVNNPLEGSATDYRGLRIRSLAMHLAGEGGGFNQIETIRSGLRSSALMNGALGVSDFAYITTEVMNRSLQAAYNRRVARWRMISRKRLAADFRELTSVRAGGDFSLKPTTESGEYLQSVITDEAEGLKLAKYGRAIHLTFEAIVNDDMGVFERLPTDFSRAAGTLESKIAWGLIRDNARLKSDNLALFQAAKHKNLGAAGPINVENIGQGRAAMFEQRAFGSTDVDDFIQVDPDLLFVPPKLEAPAGQFLTLTTPNNAEDANPFQGKLKSVVEASLSAAAGGSDTQWYLFSSEMPVLEHAYLEGFEAPTVTTEEKANPDGVSMTARHIFGASVNEFRGAYRRG